MLTSIVFLLVFIIIDVKGHEIAIRKEPHPLYRTEAVLDGCQLSKRHLDIYMAVLFISIGRMPFLTPTPDNADNKMTFIIVCYNKIK